MVPVGGIVAVKRAMELKDKFVEKGAISPQTALTLEELGLQKRGLFRLLQLKERIVEINDRYYFDVDSFDDAAINRFRKFVHELFDDLKDQ